MAWTGVTIADLNNFMKDYEYPRLDVDKVDHIGLFNLLKGNIDSQSFLAGNEVEWRVRTKAEMRTRAHTDGGDLPYPGTLGYEVAKVGIKQVITTAGVTGTSMEVAVGGTQSWGQVVQEALDAMFEDLDTTLTQIAYGDGTGRLGVVKSEVTTANGVYNLTLDNNYYNFGIENSQMIRLGQMVDVYTAGGDVVITGAEVTGVSPGNRKNGAAVDGTVQLTHGTAVGTIPADAVLYIYGSKGQLPMGLIGILNSGSAMGVSGATFQNLSRANYSLFKTPVYTAADFAGGTPGTPANWDLTDITSMLKIGYKNSKRLVTHLLMSPEMAYAFNRLNAATFNVQVNSPADKYPAVGDMMADSFLYDKGHQIAIITDWNIPENVIFGIHAPDLVIWTRGQFDFLREYGGVWEPSRGNRAHTFEAPYKGWLQLGAWRTDACFVAMDLRTDVG